MQQSKRYSTIDILKFVFAYAIAIHHFLQINQQHCYYYEKIIPIIVAFFFSVSGFLLFKKIGKNNKDNKRIIIKYARRILILYLFWTLTIFIFRIPDIIKTGFNFKEQLLYWAKYIRVVLFIGEYQLWYLIGLIWILILFYFLLKKDKLKWNLIVATTLWIIHFIIENINVNGNPDIIRKILIVYKLTGNTTRNGLLTGYIFFIIGCLIAKYERKIIELFNKQIIYYILATIGVIISILTFLVNRNSYMDFFVEPIIVSIMLILSILINISKNTQVIGSYSSIVFLGHTFFILLCNRIIGSNSIYLQLIVILVIITVFAMALERISRKHSILKILY